MKRLDTIFHIARKLKDASVLKKPCIFCRSIAVKKNDGCRNLFHLRSKQTCRY